MADTAEALRCRNWRYDIESVLDSAIESQWGNHAVGTALAVQYAQAMVYPTPLIFYSIGGVPLVIPGSNKFNQGTNG